MTSWPWRAALAGLLGLLPAADFAAPARASSDGWVAGHTPVSARLVAAPAAVGDLAEIRAGVEIRLGSGWKTYWRAPGDAGLPPAIDWGGSDNLAAANFDYPIPHRFSVLGIETIGYDRGVIFPVRATPQRRGEPMRLNAAGDLLVCADICVPERFALSLTLPAGPAEPSVHANAVARAFAAIPGDGGAAGVRVEQAAAAGTAVRVTLTGDPPLIKPDLFVETEPYLAFSAPVVEAADGGRVTLRVTAIDAPPGTELSGRSLRLTVTDTANRETVGVGGETAGRAADFTVVAVPMGTPVNANAKINTVVAPSDGVSPSLLTMLGVALLGGLILNLMPCVLPVLSLKLLSVVRHGGQSAGAARAGFLATAAGVVASFMALAAVTAGLKAAGSAVGWGVQFQQPLFLAFMIGIMLLFAANLAGWFEIPLPRAIADRLGGAEGGGLGGAFATGAFATLMATPCSAPFLGTAVGFALAAGTLEVLAIFLALGLGMASPYLLAAAFPRVAGLLPRPGRWMVALRRVMALAMVATAVWLGGVLATQLTGPDPAHAETASDGAGGARWAAFDDGAIAGHVAAGRVVVVDVTADWCVTCQANKKLVLNRGVVAEKLAGGRVVAMRADWTRPDENIARFLARYGRYGVPFNIVYGPQAPQGLPLPELLSDSVVLAALTQAGL